VSAKSPQQLDPLGALDAWPVAFFCALIAVTGSFVSTVAAAFDARPVLTVTLSFTLLVIAMAIVVVSAHPSRAPFARWAFAVALVLATASAIAGIAAERVLTAPSLWAPFGLALFFLATASYRSGRELVGYGSVATAAVVFTGVLAARLTGNEVAGMLLSGMVVGTPVLGAALGAAAYARSYARSVSGWRERAGREAREFAGDQREQLAADVHENVLGVLNREMLPFFRRMLEKDAIAEDDSVNARAVADVVRRIIVAENDRSWLDHVLVREWRGSAEPFDPKAIVHDPERIVDEVEGTARAALMAYIILVLRRGAHPEQSGLQVRAASSGSVRTVEVRVAADVFSRRGRTELRPYLSVLYATFAAVAITRSPEQLTLRLTYGHPNDR
jgi:hypothetical protein